MRMVLPLPAADEEAWKAAWHGAVNLARQRGRLVHAPADEPRHMLPCSLPFVGGLLLAAIAVLGPKSALKASGAFTI